MPDVAQSQVGRSQQGGAPLRCAVAGPAVVAWGSGAIIRG